MQKINVMLTAFCPSGENDLIYGGRGSDTLTAGRTNTAANDARYCEEKRVA